MAAATAAEETALINLEMAAATAAEASIRPFSILYIFAGAQRKSDIEECFSKICSFHGTPSHIECIDLCRSSSNSSTVLQIPLEGMDILENGRWNILKGQL